MIKPQIPDNEEERLKALKEYQILDTLPEALYDDITKIASQICETPIALISLIDDKRQWFKSHHGLGVSETDKDLAYCAHAINDPGEILEVPDAYKDERFHDNPLATGEPYVRFYAGAPLQDDLGFTLGTLCVIDHEPKQLSNGQKESLWALSRQVVALLKLRRENLQRRQIDEDFTDLIDHLGDGVFELDEDGKCTYANTKMLEMLNRDLNEVMNTSIWDMIYHEDVPSMKAYYGEQFRKKSARCYYEYRITSKGGNPIWIQQNTTMEYDGPKMVKLRSIARDMSENKELKLELERKESLYKLVSENSSDFIALHEPDGTYKYVSPSSKELLGYDPSELMGENPYDFIHADDKERLQTGPHQQTLKGQSMHKVEYRFRKKDGSCVWLESYTKPIFSEEGIVVSFQTSSRDISERRAEREQLEIAKNKAEEASEAKDNFLSMMSHEIRTPLNGIIGTTHLLINKSNISEQLPHLNILKQSGDNLLAIVNDILDFNKIEEGKIVIDNSVFNFREVIDLIYENYTFQANEKGIHLSLDYDDNLSAFYQGDSVRISQVLHNLISNAIKFTDKGVVKLSIQKVNQHDNFDEIQFKVEDSGIGIPEDKQEGIFDKFVQAERSTTRQYGGSGLGLSIIKRLLELMNSQIHLESKEGKGSTFHFNLILHSHKGQHPSRTSNREDDLKMLNATILLVEDNDFNRTIAKDFLESWGCDVIEAVNGKEALPILEAKNVDLVLLDLQMPVMDGFETIRKIRSESDKYYQKLPVIALTAAALGETKEKVYQSGMNDFITKPFLPTEFYSKLFMRLGNRNDDTSNQNVKEHLLKKLEDTLGQEDGQLEKYVEIFKETMAEEHEVLKKAINNKDFNMLKSYAHKVKSSMRLVGLDEIAREAEELEDMIEQKNPDSMILDKALIHSDSIFDILNELNAKAHE